MAQKRSKMVLERPETAPEPRGSAQNRSGESAKGTNSAPATIGEGPFSGKALSDLGKTLPRRPLPLATPDSGRHLPAATPQTNLAAPGSGRGCHRGRRLQRLLHPLYRNNHRRPGQAAIDDDIDLPHRVVHAMAQRFHRVLEMARSIHAIHPRIDPSQKLAGLLMLYANLHGPTMRVSGRMGNSGETRDVLCDLRSRTNRRSSGARCPVAG